MFKRTFFNTHIISEKNFYMKKIIYSKKAPAPIGPYSQAVLAGNTLYVSGQIALELATLGDLKTETQKVMENIGHILSEAGMGYENIVKSSIFLKNMDDFGLVNEIYGSFFTSMPPARETVQVARLPKDVNVEISVIAIQ
jgi:2-iminobutanoate/2-iminopropanoate deaminase